MDLPNSLQALDIRGYTDTARKHGRDAFAVLHDLMTGNPGRPPAAAFSPVTTTGTRAAR